MRYGSLAKGATWSAAGRLFELAVGLEWTCARTSAGEARCWGENTNGTLGDGTMTSRPLPAPAR